jgi:hypothetical protein
MLQPPQFTGSVMVSTHSTVLHSVRPFLQSHTPPTHRWGWLHGMSQAPQVTPLLLAVGSVHTAGVFSVMFAGQSSVPAHEHVPLSQMSPSGQRVSHPPHMSGSEAVGAQTMLVPGPGHREVPVGQAHTLLLQTMPVTHLVPQPPQLAGSEAVSTQVGGDPHSARPWLHVQTPPTQEAPLAVHGLLHPPQLPMSVLVLTHLGGVPHIVKPLPVHELEHCPPTHAPLHVVVQLPQCCGSPLVSMQPAVPHNCLPESQAQAPSLQSLPPVHAFPHVPQLLLSVCVLKHWPPHWVWPDAQAPPPEPEAPVPVPPPTPLLKAEPTQPNTSPATRAAIKQIMAKRSFIELLVPSILHGRRRRGAGSSDALCEASGADGSSSELAVMIGLSPGSGRPRCSRGRSRC